MSQHLDTDHFRYVLANDISLSACDAMRMNVAYNGVGEDPERGGMSNGHPKALDDALSVPEDQEERVANGEAANGAAFGVAETQLPHGRRPGCQGKVKINEGDAWYVCTILDGGADSLKHADVCAPRTKSSCRCR